MPRYALVLATVAALLGVVGVALAALSTHADGGELGRTAAQFLILHAGVLIGVTAHARVADRRTARALLGAGGALALGTLVFSGDLTVRAFADARLFPMAAPIGGALMILSWIALSLVFAVDVMRDETPVEAIPDPRPPESLPDPEPRQGLGARIGFSWRKELQIPSWPGSSRPSARLKLRQLSPFQAVHDLDRRDEPVRDRKVAANLAPMPRQSEAMSDPGSRQGEAAPDPRPTLYLFCGKIAAGKSNTTETRILSSETTCGPIAARRRREYRA